MSEKNIIHLQCAFVEHVWYDMLIASVDRSVWVWLCYPSLIPLPISLVIWPLRLSSWKFLATSWGTAIPSHQNNGLLVNAWRNFFLTFNAGGYLRGWPTVSLNHPSWSTGGSRHFGVCWLTVCNQSGWDDRRSTFWAEAKKIGLRLSYSACVQICWGFHVWWPPEPHISCERGSLKRHTLLTWERTKSEPSSSARLGHDRT